MLLNVGLFVNLAIKCEAWFNARLPGGNGPLKAKTTVGEILKQWGAYGALALFPGVPIDEMWARTAKPGELNPPPAFGLHGLTKSRFEKLKELQGLMFDTDESDLDPQYAWRYCVV
eukprot:5836468-Prymnesium_polylepis.2